MGIGKLRFLVEALQFMVDGKAELEGDTLQGLYELLEDAVLQAGLERHRLLKDLAGLEQVNKNLCALKSQQIVDDFIASMQA